MKREKNRKETRFLRTCFKAKACTERAAACAYTCARLSLAIEIWPTSPSTRFADTDVLYPSKSTDRDAPIDIRGASPCASVVASAGDGLCGARCTSFRCTRGISGGDLERIGLNIRWGVDVGFDVDETEFRATRSLLIPPLIANVYFVFAAFLFYKREKRKITEQNLNLIAFSQTHLDTAIPLENITFINLYSERTIYFDNK